MTRSVASAAALSAIALSSAMTGAGAQTNRDVLGTWALVSAVAQQGDARTDVFGPNPSGTLVFGGDGRYLLIFLRGDLPKFASNNRASGTPEENKAIVQGSIAHFGTYSVDEAGKTLTFRVESSTFPNWTGVEQRRDMALSGDRLTYTSPGSAGAATQVIMRRVK